MALTYAQLIDEVARVIATGARSGDDIRTSIGRWINMACRKIAYAYPWDSRRSEQREILVAPYDTGTVAVTNGSTTVTGTGTTWTSAMTGRKFTLSIGGPYYRFTYVSATSGTLSEAYQEDTDSESTYSIFQDEYDLEATTHSVESATLIKDAFTGPLIGYEQVEADAADFVGSSTGRPVAWCVCTSTTANTPRVRFSPIPDDTYRVAFRSLKTWTDLSSDGDLYTASLPVDVEELILDRALRWAPRIEGSRQVMTDKQFREALSLVWADHNKRRYRIGHRRGFTDPATMPRIIVSMGSLAT